MTPIRIAPLGVALMLAGCAGMQPQVQDKPTGATPASTTAAPVAPPPASAEEIKEAAAITKAPPPRPAARATAAQLDTTTTAQKTAAAAPPKQAETRLGSTIASLGDPTEPGFWIKTPLVKTKTIGRIVNPATGQSAKVDLIPLPGPASAGSQVSLPALQLIGVSLTDLPEIEVYAS